MGCGSSTAKPAVDEPLAGVMPGGGSAPSAAANPRGSILGGQGVAAGAAAGATAAAPPVQPKKKVVLYDPLTSPFPPSATSLQRKVAGRAPLLQLEPYAPEWRRIPEVLLMQQQRKMGIVEDNEKEEEEEASKEQEEAAADGAADDAENKPEAAADAGVAPSKPAIPAASVFSSSTHEDNVVAGPLGDAHVIAALVSLAAHPNRLARLFRALDPPVDAATAGKNPHIAGLVVGSHLPSSSVAKVALAESGPRFAASAQSGTYEVRLFYGGLWRTLSVTDEVPVTLAGGAGPQPLFCSSRDGTEFWMMLVEKALARACGSYEDLMLQTPAQLFRMLTGGSAETMQLPRPASAAALADGSAGASTEECDKLWAQLQVCWSRSDLLAATTRELSQSQHAAVASSKTLRATRAAASHAQGESAQHYFLHDHAELGIGAFYSVLDVQSLPVSCGGARLVLFRNPGGSQHFDGRWSEGSAEWKALEAAGGDGSGAMHAARLRLAKKKHVLLVSADAASSPSGSAQQQHQQQGDGIFWLDWEDVLRHFGAIFICSVLADQYDHCYVGEGRWEGKSAAGSPPECVPPPGSHTSTNGPAVSSTGVFVHNPTFRIRNTSAKRSPPLVITLSKGAAMCAAAMAAPGGGPGAAAAGGQHARGRSTAAHDSQQQQQAPAAKRGSVIGASLASVSPAPASASAVPVHIGFRIVTNQLTHSLNCNAPVSSPTFGLLQLSPLHDLVASSALSGDSAVSLTLPALMPYVDYFLVPYTAAAGVEADFVATIWSQSGSILFDRCAAALPGNPLELPLEWKRSRKTAGGNVWSDAYLSNPVFKVVSSAPEGTPVSLLFNLVKTSPSPSADGSGAAAAAAAGLDANVNMALLANTAPHALSTTAIGCVSAPAKPGAIGASGAGAASAAGGKKPGAAEPAPASADDAATAGASVSFAVAAGPTKKGKTLLPVVGVLSPWHEVVPGGCTRVSEGGGGLYSAQRAYAMVVEKLQPGREHFLLASQFLPGGEGAALLQVYSSALEHVSVERVDPRQSVVAEGRWAGVNAAGPARRKKTYLNNPQFCLRHQAPTPMSVVVSLQFLGPLGCGGGGGGSAGVGGGSGSSAEASFNIAFCTYPSGSADPNPYTAAEKEEQKRRRKDGEKRSAAAAEDRKKRDVAEKKAAATAQEKLTGKGAGAETGASASAAAAASAPSFGVASLRIKTKDRAGGSSKKKDGHKSSNNMFGNLDAEGADAGEDGLADGGGGGGVARVNPLSTDYELLAQTSHSGDLYRPARLMHLFIAEVVPDKSYFIVPSTAVPGLEGEFELRVFGGQPGELRLDPCFLNSAGDAIDMSGLASRRVSNAMIAGLASHKVKKVEGTGKSGSTKPKKKH